MTRKIGSRRLPQHIGWLIRDTLAIGLWITCVKLVAVPRENPKSCRFSSLALGPRFSLNYWGIRRYAFVRGVILFLKIVRFLGQVFDWPVDNLWNVLSPAIFQVCL